ncbi:hypothetical protein AB0E25_05180 [Streptomyces bobili]|uniref:hypothetical protein n=1 Tax=Streptomyces bobili TaxID=67280 RepID=UPI0034028139
MPAFTAAPDADNVGVLDLWATTPNSGRLRTFHKPIDPNGPVTVGSEAFTDYQSIGPPSLAPAAVRPPRTGFGRAPVIPGRRFTSCTQSTTAVSDCTRSTDNHRFMNTSNLF